MRERIGKSDVSDESLQAFFDGELSGSEAEAVQRSIDEDPELREELEQLGLVRGLVTHGLMRQANRVPQARFEQIWDQIDRAIANEARREEAAAPVSMWSRIWSAVRPLRWPAVAAAAAAVVTLVVVQGGPSDPNKSQPIAVEEQPAPSAETAPEKAIPPEPDMIAQKPTTQLEPDAEDLAPMPVPEGASVEIHNVDFGGRSGRISNTGTTVVLYVEEDVGPADSERSL